MAPPKHSHSRGNSRKRLFVFIRSRHTEIAELLANRDESFEPPGRLMTSPAHKSLALSGKTLRVCAFSCHLARGTEVAGTIRWMTYRPMRRSILRCADISQPSVEHKKVTSSPFISCPRACGSQFLLPRARRSVPSHLLELALSLPEFCSADELRSQKPFSFPPVEALREGNEF
jgi:hypothetical protein